MTKEQTIEANETYGVARTTVARLLSPQIFGAAGLQHVSGDVLGLRTHGCGKMWDFLNVAERIKVRDKVIRVRAWIAGRLAHGWINDVPSRTKFC